MKRTDYGSNRRRSLRFIDAEVTPYTAKEVASMIKDHASSRTKLMIANLNLHGAYMLYKDPSFTNFTKSSDICLCDGWPILKLVQDPKLRVSDYRVGSTDWLDELIADDNGGIDFVSIGGTSRSAEKAKQNIVKLNSSIRWTAFSGYGETSPVTNVELRQALDKANVVLVGMGMPRQEKWILDNRKFLQGKVVANVGGCMDYYSGEQNLAPRWLGSIGLEWAYRLAKSPRRLAKRYLIEPILLAWAIVRTRRTKNESF